VKRRRRLRRLVPDAELIRRRAAGETLRELACDYRVAHTTLGRYFVRPEVKRQLKQAAIQLRSEQRQLRARHAAERRLEQEVRQRADEQIAAEREQERRYRKDFAEWLRRRPSTHDKEAEQAVAAGGGTRALLAATELPTVETAAGTIDPVILARAFDNNARERAQPWPLTSKRGPRLRRLVPDTELLRRRAAGEPLRTLAGDYDVAHSTLGRFFARPQIQKQLRQTRQQLRPERRALTARRAATRRLEPKARRKPTAEPEQPRRAHTARSSN
jgi:hypothetical protein